jgi:uncharacterized protein involved in response to NO
MAIPRLRDYQGPALLSYGFRPFFLLGSLYSGLSMMLWMPQFYGELELATHFSPVDWHVHELFFGYLSAVVTGFLFTAVPNWTGRMPIQGIPLLCLVLLWLAGRFTVTFSAFIGWLPAMAVDLAFLSAITLVIGSEIMAGKNWRNLKVLLPLLVLLAANTGFHLEVQFAGTSDISRRLAMAAAITLIMLIGGRIIPSFTHNWLVRENPGRLPVPFNRFDLFSIAVGVAALAAWIASPSGSPVGVLMALAALVHLARLSRWAGDRTLRDPLVAVLHVAYLFIPAGFALLALAVFQPDNVPAIAGVHALGAGAIGCMTLSVMVRATLGHTGQALKAGIAEKLVFASVIIAALARIAAALDLGQIDLMLHIAAFGWFIAFAGFAAVYAPLFLKPRRQQ